MQTETARVEESGEAAAGIDLTEARLTSRISELWQVHIEAQSAIHKTRDGLKVIRIHLGRRLHELKAVLSRPGRGGEWSAFLASSGIPRSTADRLVRSHEGTLTCASENCSTGATDEPIDATVRRKAESLWPRLSRLLTTSESFEMFISDLRTAAEKTLVMDANAKIPAEAAHVAESEEGEKLCERVLPTVSSLAATATAADPENQIPLAAQPEALLHGSTSVQQAHFSSSFLRETNGGNNLNHTQRSLVRARLRSIRRKEELTFELAV